MRILVVEDEQRMAAGLRAGLEAEGFAVDVASIGVDGLWLARERPPDVSTEGAWEAGVDGAQPGIVMPARPQVGDSYRQEHYQGEAEDTAEVLSLTESATVAVGTYEDVLVTEDINALEPDVVEHKYYARGVGPIFTVQVQGGSDREELVEAPG